jgi:hypothetical protein
MTEYLHEKLVDTLRAHGVNPALSEDEIDRYPYVTFELPVEYRYTKDGPYKIVGNLTIRSVSDDIDEAEDLRAGIMAAIAGGFGDPSEAEDPAEEVEVVEQEATEEEIVHDYDEFVFSASITDVRKDCMDGVWVIELDYILNQYE